MLLEQREAVVPESIVMRNPIAHGREFFRNHPVAPLPAIALLPQETGIEQNAQVLRDGRSAHPEMPAHPVHGVLVFGEQIEDAPPGGMTDGGENVRLAISNRHDLPTIRKESLTCQIGKAPILVL